MSIVDLMQWVGALGVGLFYPLQNWRAFATRRPVGLSFLAFSVLLVGVAGYIALGIRLSTPIFTALNASNFFFDILLLLLMWFWSPVLVARERAAGLAIMTFGLSGLVAAHIFLEQHAASISGWIGLAGIVGFYPIQNAQLFTKRNPTGLSLAAFVSLLIGLCALTVFGVLINDLTVILGNGFTALGTLLILWGIIRWRKT